MSWAISAEIIFGMPDQKLTIRHDSGNSARPYADGALLAIRKVPTLVGVHRGLDSVLDLWRGVERRYGALSHLPPVARYIDRQTRGCADGSCEPPDRT